MKNKGIQIAVVSHNPLLKEILDRLRITHLINNYFIGNNNESLSASTNIYKFAATSLQLNPNELIVFIIFSSVKISSELVASSNTINEGFL